MGSGCQGTIYAIGPIIRSAVTPNPDRSKLFQGVCPLYFVWQRGKRCRLSKWRNWLGAKSTEIYLGVPSSHRQNRRWVIFHHRELRYEMFSSYLPDRFLDRIGESGQVVSEWAKQVEILSHPSVEVFFFYFFITLREWSSDDCVATFPGAYDECYDRRSCCRKLL